MGLQEPVLTKRAKIDYLRLLSDEWTRVGQFADLLSVRENNLHLHNLILIKCAF